MHASLLFLFRRLSAFPSVMVYATLLILSGSSARANLLSPEYETQLEAWLGQGDLTFSILYTKQAGDSTLNFHAAVDRNGPTFTLMNIFGAGLQGTTALSSQIVGGYDPQSWSSTDGYHFTFADADRTAFIYNLTGGTLQRQSLSSNPLAGGAGQTYNSSQYGPAFGTDGSDLLVGDPTGSFRPNTLDFGRAYNISYGGTGFGGPSIVTGSPNLSGKFFSFNVGELEVYTFAPASGGSAVPDTAGTLGLLGASVLALTAFRRRQA